LVAVVSDGITVWHGPRFDRAVSLKSVPRALAMGRAFVSANGRLVAAQYPRDAGVGDPNAVSLWDGRTGAPSGTISLEKGRVQGVALSDQGKGVAVFGDIPAQGALLRVHRLGPTGPREILRWESSEHRTTYAAAFSPSGQLFALSAGRRVILWDLRQRRILGQSDVAAMTTLLPKTAPSRATISPAHQIAFSPSGEQLSTLHGFGVVGVALWRVSTARGPSRAALRPEAWISRPATGGTVRQVAWDRKNRLWLITATYSPSVWVHAQRGDRFVEDRVLSP
jgi:hypothetical protein